MAVYQLSLSIIIFLITPYLYRYIQHRTLSFKIMQILMNVAMMVLVFVHLLPEAYHMSGDNLSSVVVLFLLGMGLFSVVEKYFHSRTSFLSKMEIFIAFATLSLHTLMDGLAIYIGEMQGLSGAHALIGWSVVLHQLPFAFVLWSILERNTTFTKGMLFVSGISVMAVVGYWGGHTLILLSYVQSSLAYVQSFICGALLHVVWEPYLHGGKHAHHACGHKHEEHSLDRTN